MAFVLMLPLLAACSPSGETPSTLPPVPADIQACFRKGVGGVPTRALNVSEVESLWKNDRVRIVVLQTCGKRFFAWYENLRVNWK
jgi:hypothetical protein